MRSIQKLERALPALTRNCLAMTENPNSILKEFERVSGFPVPVQIPMDDPEENLDELLKESEARRRPAYECPTFMFIPASGKDNTIIRELVSHLEKLYKWSLPRCVDEDMPHVFFDEDIAYKQVEWAFHAKWKVCHHNCDRKNDTPLREWRHIYI